MGKGEVGLENMDLKTKTCSGQVLCDSARTRLMGKSDKKQVTIRHRVLDRYEHVRSGGAIT